MIELSVVNSTPEEEKALLRVLRSGQIASGPETDALEAEVSQLLGGASCVAVTNGTMGLTISLAAMGIGPGDEVITTAFSFVGTVEPILQLGATPVFVDVEGSTGNIDVSKVEAAITKRTAAIVPVHLYGRPMNLKALREIAERRAIPIVEDACQAVGARWGDQELIGATGTTVFSFYGSKNITCGEGGMVCTDDPRMALRLRLLRNHGASEMYRHLRVGYNARITDMQSALLRAQFNRLGVVTSLRQANAQFYDRSINNPSIELPSPNGDGVISCYHQYVLRVPGIGRRDELGRWAEQHNVQTRVYYPYTIPRLPFIKSLGLDLPCPNADELCETVLAIPVRDGLTHDERQTVADVLNSWKPSS
jgi:dTDP-4-amino-4,6-dideoxygalactose transaminase